MAQQIPKAQKANANDSRHKSSKKLTDVKESNYGTLQKLIDSQKLSEYEAGYIDIKITERQSIIRYEILTS